MGIEQRLDGDVAIFDVSGKIMIGLGDVLIRESVKKALAAGHHKILLNMHAVTALDSAGVGELVAGYTSVKNQGGSLRLCRLSPKVDAILQLTHLLGVFDIYSSEEEALVAFALEG